MIHPHDIAYQQLLLLHTQALRLDHARHRRDQLWLDRRATITAVDPDAALRGVAAAEEHFAGQLVIAITALHAGDGANPLTRTDDATERYKFIDELIDLLGELRVRVGITW